MNRPCPLTAVFLLLTAMSKSQEPKPDSPRPTLDQLSWLVGTWSGQQGDTETEEHWITPKGGMMLGINRSVRASGRSSFEFLRIADTGKEIVYFASPGGRPPTPFTLTNVSETRAVFENREHDFPQRIIYDRNGAEMKARIEGKLNGQDRSMEWNWTRTE